MIAKLIVGVVLVKATIATPLPMPMPMPMPQLIVKSQSNLFREQPGRQIDLSQILPTKELFWLNLEEVRFPIYVLTSNPIGFIANSDSQQSLSRSQHHTGSNSPDSQNLLGQIV